jgi:hypothetical protein
MLGLHPVQFGLRLVLMALVAKARVFGLSIQGGGHLLHEFVARRAVGQAKVVAGLGFRADEPCLPLAGGRARLLRVASLSDRCLVSCSD